MNRHQNRQVALTVPLQDLSAGMIMQARAGAPLDALRSKAIRNTELVLYEGQRGVAE